VSRARAVLARLGYDEADETDDQYEETDPDDEEVVNLAGGVDGYRPRGRAPWRFVDPYEPGRPA
jgi:hypothetical protein